MCCRSVSVPAHRRVWVVVAVLLGLTACTGDVDDESGASVCVPSTVAESGSGFPEVRGEGAEAWALLWETSPWAVDQAVKVVWRMPGSGDLEVRAVGPSGEVVAPSSGPTSHPSSNWDRPGDEWGTFFTLPSEGCWRLEARRTDATSAININVTVAAA
jgi:hypothetical protein